MGFNARSKPPLAEHQQRSLRGSLDHHQWRMSGSKHKPPDWQSMELTAAPTPLETGLSMELATAQTPYELGLFRL